MCRLHHRHPTCSYLPAFSASPSSWLRLEALAFVHKRPYKLGGGELLVPKGGKSVPGWRLMEECKAFGPLNLLNRTVSP